MPRLAALCKEFRRLNEIVNEFIEKIESFLHFFPKYL